MTRHLGLLVGGSGTLAYTPPEALVPSATTGHYPPPDRTTDMWALGLVLHLLVFFALPFAEAGPEGDTRKLEEEIKMYHGFVGPVSSRPRPSPT